MTYDSLTCKLACDKYYVVVHHEGLITHKGYLLNYHGGSVILMTEEGIVYIDYQDIQYMAPLKRPSAKLEQIGKAYAEILNK